MKKINPQDKTGDQLNSINTFGMILKMYLKSIEKDYCAFRREMIQSLLFIKKKKRQIRKKLQTHYFYKCRLQKNCVLANRLQKVANRIINRDQSAYIKERNTGENDRFILDIFEYYENKSLDGILLFLDFEKAFDSVEYNFMFKIL